MTNVLKIGDKDFIAIARDYDIDVSLLKALIKVETNGAGGFLENGRPVILFEGHIFWRQLRRVGINPKKYAGIFPNIVYPKWDKSQYRGGNAEYMRLSLAIAIHKHAALRSASWGMFQVMGFNCKACGSSGIENFVAAMSLNEASQLRLSLNFMYNARLLPLLREHKWTDFARLYNGPSYKLNNYDEKLSDAYAMYSLKL